MNTLICHKWGAIKESQILGFVFDDKGKLFACTKENAPQPITPYPEDELRQLIRDGKLDSRDLGRFSGFGLAAARSDVPEQDANLPALLFLVRDGKGNVKLRNAESLVRSLSVGSVDDAVHAGFDGGVNFAAYIGNPFLRSGDAEKDVG